MNKYNYLEDLVKICSYKLEENKEIVNYLSSKFKDIAEEIVRVKNTTNARESLIIGLNCKLNSLNNAIVLSGHMDTVAPSKEYLTNPLDAVKIEDKIFGLGTIDMKSFFAVILNNLETIKKSKKPIIIAISCDEETEQQGVRNIIKYLDEHKIKIQHTLVGEPSNNNVCTKSKSCFAYAIEIFGKSCHSSQPQNGINANIIMAKLIMFIEQLSHKFKDTTLSTNVVSGGTKVNIISSYAKMEFDLRTYSVDFSNKIIKKIKKYLIILQKKYFGSKIELKQYLEIPPFYNKNILFKNICNKLNLQINDFVGGCEAGYYQALGGDAFVFGVGDLSLAHKENEYVSISEFDKYEKLLLELIKELNKN